MTATPGAQPNFQRAKSSPRASVGKTPGLQAPRAPQAPRLKTSICTCAAPQPSPLLPPGARRGQGSALRPAAAPPPGTGRSLRAPPVPPGGLRARRPARKPRPRPRPAAPVPVVHVGPVLPLLHDPARVPLSPLGHVSGAARPRRRTRNGRGGGAAPSPTFPAGEPRSTAFAAPRKCQKSPPSAPACPARPAAERPGRASRARAEGRGRGQGPERRRACGPRRPARGRGPGRRWIRPGRGEVTAWETRVGGGGGCGWERGPSRGAAERRPKRPGLGPGGRVGSAEALGSAAGLASAVAGKGEPPPPPEGRTPLHDSLLLPQ